MATVDECRAALEQLATRMADVDDEGTRRHSSLNRTLSCHLTDLGATFSGALRDGHIQDITLAEAPRAQIRLTLSSDDLLALVAGELHFAGAWAKGRLKVEASMRDLLKLRSLL